MNGRARPYLEHIYHRSVIDVQLPTPKQGREGLPSGKGVFITEQRLVGLERSYHRRIAGLKQVVDSLSASRDALLRLRAVCADIRTDLGEVLESVKLLPGREQHNYERLYGVLTRALEDTDVDKQIAGDAAEAQGAPGGDRAAGEHAGGGAGPDA